MNPVNTSQQWAEVRAELANESSSLLAFFDEAKKHPKIARLFPFLSMQQVCFSRCSRYPFFSDFFVEPSSQGFSLKRTSGRGGWMEGFQIAGGSAAFCAQKMAELLPEGYGPAYDCSAEELRAAFDADDGTVRRLADLEKNH